MKAVIGVIGRNGAGKDELVRYLNRKHKVKKIVMGDIVRDIARDKNIEPTRENLHRISKESFSEEGEDTFVKKVVEKIEKDDAETYAVSGIRTPKDIETMREYFGSDFKLVHVETTHPWVRFERIQERGTKRDTENFDLFRKLDQEEDELFHMDEAIRKADTTVNNDGTKDFLYQNIEAEIVDKYLKSGNGNNQ